MLRMHLSFSGTFTPYPQSLRLGGVAKGPGLLPHESLAAVRGWDVLGVGLPAYPSLHTFDPKVRFPDKHIPPAPVLHHPHSCITTLRGQQPPDPTHTGKGIQAQ